MGDQRLSTSNLDHVKSRVFMVLDETKLDRLMGSFAINLAFTRYKQRGLSSFSVYKAQVLSLILIHGGQRLEKD